MTSAEARKLQAEKAAALKVVQTAFQQERAEYIKENAEFSAASKAASAAAKA